MQKQLSPVGVLGWVSVGQKDQQFSGIFSFRKGSVVLLFLDNPGTMLYLHERIGQSQQWLTVISSYDAKSFKVQIRDSHWPDLAVFVANDWHLI